MTFVVGVGFIWINPVAVLIVGGIISIMLASIRSEARAAVDSTDLWKAWPFPNLASIQRAIQRAATFRKRRYRREILERGHHVPFGYIRLPEIIQWPLSRLGWCFVSPLVLLFQCLPIRAVQETFHEPDSNWSDAA